MKILNSEIDAAIKQMVVEITTSQNINKKYINAMMRKFSSQLGISFEDFKSRIEAEIAKNAPKYEAAIINQLIAENREANIKYFTAHDIDAIVKEVMNGEHVFTEWKTNKRNEFIFKSYNFNATLKKLEQNINSDIRSRMYGAIASGRTPDQMASQLASSIKNGKDRMKIRRNIKTLYTSIQYKAHSVTDIRTMKKNSKYVDWVEWRTVGDIRVTETCRALEKESIQKKYKPTQLPEYMITPAHFNCRCKLVPRMD